MDSKTYTLTIEGQNGTFTVGGLTMNGSNYVSGTMVDTSRPDFATQKQREALCIKAPRLFFSKII